MFATLFQKNSEVGNKDPIYREVITQKQELPRDLLEALGHLGCKQQTLTFTPYGEGRVVTQWEAGPAFGRTRAQQLQELASLVPGVSTLGKGQLLPLQASNGSIHNSICRGES